MRISRVTGVKGLLTAALSLLSAVLPAGATTGTDAYVVSTGTNTVTVVDTATSTVRTTLLVGTGPSRVTVSPDGTRAYVSHPSLGYVTVIDTFLPAVLGTIATATGPGEVAVTPNGQQLWVGVAGGVQVIDLSTGTPTATVPLTGTLSELVFSPDGTRAYAAHSLLSIIDVAGHAVTATTIPATALALMPSGQKLYASSSSGLHAVDTATNTVTQTLGTAGTAGALALTPDGSRLYVGVQGSNLVCSSYGCGSLAFRNVTVFETAGNTAIATITVSAPVNRLAVTPNRSHVYMLIPSTSLFISPVNAGAGVTRALGAGVNDLAMTPNPGAVLVPYTIDAVNDTASATLVSNYGGTAVSNVLANDKLGGLPATQSNVILSQVSATHAGISLNVATGTVRIEPGLPAGAHSLEYKICETASPDNCDQAIVSFNVRLPYVIRAVDDSAVTNAGKAIHALANDTLNALPATTANVRVTQVSSSHAGFAIATNGYAYVAAGTPFGTYSLVYRICEATVLENCAEATVTAQVVPYFIQAVNDAGVVTKSGGTAVANVLANDRFDTGVATLARVSLTTVSSTNAGVVLNATTGAVTVAAGTPKGAHALVYRICELGGTTNCAQATVAVTVNPYTIFAGNDTARASSKVAGTALASVLWNDTLGGARATVATVRISLVSLTPANSKVKLDVTDGSVDVLGKTSSGYYSLVYKICEIADPTNCAQGTVSLDLSGSDGL